MTSAALPLGQRIIGTQPKVANTEKRPSVIVFIISFISSSLTSPLFKAEQFFKINFQNF